MGPHFGDYGIGAYGFVAFISIAVTFLAALFGRRCLRFLLGKQVKLIPEIKKNTRDIKINLRIILII